MKLFSSTKKILLSVAVLNVILLSTYAFIFWRIKADSDSVKEILTQSSSDFQKSEMVRKAKIELSANEDFIKKIDSYFIPTDGVVNFINNIEELGKTYSVGTTINSIEPVLDPKATKDFKETIHVSLSSTGTWQNVSQFLSVVESLPYRVVLEQVQFTLMDSADKLPYASASSTTARIKAPNEKWKATMDLTILKLK